MKYTVLKVSLASLAIAVLAGCSSDDASNINQFGAQPDLPQQDDALFPAMHIATPKGWDGELPTVPEGYSVSAIASNLKIPRRILVLPNGDLLVAEGSGGHAPKVRPKDVIAGFIKSQGKSSVKGGDSITLLRDSNGDGITDLQTTFITGLDAPYGLALIDDILYVANQGGLVRFRYTEGATSIAGSGEEVTQLPSKINHHWTKSMAVSSDNTKIYVGIGSNSNIGERGLEVEQDRAQIWEIDPANGASRVYAAGVRNPTALAINPWTNGLWAVANERDELGPRLVPDYLTSIRDGGFYGWPYSYWGQNTDSRVYPQNPELVKTAISPDYSLGSHHAPLGLTFTSDGSFGGPYLNGAFIGEHGSWNRQDLAGYRVTFVAFKNGRPVGDPVPVVTGFIKDGHARGRPVGVTYDAKRGALYVADDLSNTVWRIVKTGGSAKSG